MKKLIMPMLFICMITNNIHEMYASKLGDFCRKNPGMATMYGAALVGGSLLAWQQISALRARNKKVQLKRLKKIKVQSPYAYNVLKKSYDAGEIQSLSYWHLGNFCSSLHVGFENKQFIKASHGFRNYCKRSSNSKISAVITDHKYQGREIILGKPKAIIWPEHNVIAQAGDYGVRVEDNEQAEENIQPVAPTRAADAQGAEERVEPQIGQQQDQVPEAIHYNMRQGPLAEPEHQRLVTFYPNLAGSFPGITVRYHTAMTRTMPNGTVREMTDNELILDARDRICHRAGVSREFVMQ